MLIFSIFADSKPNHCTHLYHCHMAFGCVNSSYGSRSSAVAGCHHEGLSAPERGGDVQVSPGGGGAVGHHGVSAGWSTDQHCV